MRNIGLIGLILGIALTVCTYGWADEKGTVPVGETAPPIQVLTIDSKFADMGTAANTTCSIELIDYKLNAPDTYSVALVYTLTTS